MTIVLNTFDSQIHFTFQAKAKVISWEVLKYIHYKKVSHAISESPPKVLEYCKIVHLKAGLLLLLYAYPSQCIIFRAV